MTHTPEIRKLVRGVFQVYVCSEKDEVLLFYILFLTPMLKM